MRRLRAAQPGQIELQAGTGVVFDVLGPGAVIGEEAGHECEGRGCDGRELLLLLLNNTFEKKFSQK